MPPLAIRHLMTKDSHEHESSPYLELLTYTLVAFAFAAYVLLSQGGVSHQSDLLIIGLATLLISYTVLLSLTRSGMIESFELTATGLKAKFFRRIREYEKSVEPEKVPKRFGWTIGPMVELQADRGIALFRTIGDIENELRNLAAKNDIRVDEKASPRHVVDVLQNEGILTKPVAHAAAEYLYIRNQIVHGRVRLTDSNIEEALAIGAMLLSDLRRLSGSQSRDASY